MHFWFWCVGMWYACALLTSFCFTWLRSPNLLLPAVCSIASHGGLAPSHDCLCSVWAFVSHCGLAASCGCLSALCACCSMLWASGRSRIASFTCRLRPSRTVDPDFRFQLSIQFVLPWRAMGQSLRFGLSW